MSGILGASVSTNDGSWLIAVVLAAMVDMLSAEGVIRWSQVEYLLLNSINCSFVLVLANVDPDDVRCTWILKMCLILDLESCILKKNLVALQLSTLFLSFLYSPVLEGGEGMGSCILDCIIVASQI